MKRRSFLKSTLVTSSLGGIVPLASGNLFNDMADKKLKQEFYELRTYTLGNNRQENIVKEYFQKAAIPAYNRLGIKNIGVFTEMKPDGQTRLFVIIPFQTFDDYLRIQEKLDSDVNYKDAAAAYLNAPATAPAYERIESALLKSFAHFPKIEVPPNTPRMFELRRYENASESACKKKLEMFNEAGEIDIFKKVGLTPVFFGETLVGPLRPNLTYMITFDDMAEHDKNWKLFGSDPQWKLISAKPEYADDKLVSRITSIFLVPTDFSQV